MQGGEHTNCWEKYEVTGNGSAGLEGKIFGGIRNRPGAILVPAQSPLLPCTVACPFLHRAPPACCLRAL